MSFASIPYTVHLLPSRAPRALPICLRFLCLRRRPCSPFPSSMAQIRVLDPFAWPRSTATRLSLEELVTGGQLTPAGDGPQPAWMILPMPDREPNPPPGYVVSSIRLHECGFNAPASRFMWGLCHHYWVELHNFVPNAISQAASFIAVCEGFLGIPANWDLCVHLFRGELHTLTTGERGHIERFAPAASRSRCGTRARSCTCRVPRHPTTPSGRRGGSTSATTAPVSHRTPGRC
jgi:hypothetical protein